MTDDRQTQAETIAFLSSPEAHGGAAVDRIDTHASVIFLAGDRAWKLKRAVRYAYLDFSTLERRRAMCLAELALNQPHAPGIYRRVVPVTRDRDGRLAIDGTGEPVDWLIEMSRFDQNELFDRLAARGALDLDLMPPLAAAIARLHARAERRPDHGGHAAMAWVIDGNAAAFQREASAAVDPARASRVVEDARALNDRLRALLDDRRHAGFVRAVHGDLHLRNIVRFEGVPTLFDAVEFNERISCVDVMYDLAFVLMDLWRLPLPSHANALLNAYIRETTDEGTLDALAALPLWLACRATVRAKTSATEAGMENDSARRAELAARANAYLSLADRLLHPAPAVVVAIGGLSGTGKSVLARALAPDSGPAPGAVILRSDEQRKTMFGVDPATRLGQEAYSADVTARVYNALGARAARVVTGRHAVVVDATFLRAEQRRAIEATARAAGVPFVGLWLDVPEGVRLERAGRRVADASDATAEVARRQTVEDEAAISWHRLDASGTPADVLTAARARLGTGRSAASSSASA